jgi:uncharacterized protein YbjT (DUF2867 family)
MYVVAGVTGQTGGVTASTLIAAGHKVRVIVRRPEQGAAWSKRGAAVAVADLADATALTAALGGAEAAFLLSPPNYGSPDPFAAAERLADAFAQALPASNVRRAVILSSAGAHLAAGTGIIRTLHILEQRLAGLAVPLTFLRPFSFAENWAQVLDAVTRAGVLPSFVTALDQPMPQVSVADIGATAAALMAEPWSGRRVIELSGPVDVPPNEVAATFARLLDKPVAAMAVPRADWVGILTAQGLSPAAAQAIAAMYDGINAGVVGPEDGRGGGTVEARRGVVALDTSLAALLRVAPASQAA